MTIINPERYLEGIWDWAILDGCFGDTKIKPTDIDGFVERWGHFLVIETKHPGASVPQGQRMTFNALREIGVFTIIVVWGISGVVKYMEVLYPPPIQPTPKKPADISDLRKVVRWWFGYANKRKVYNTS